ncbi:hypothetical protein DUGA6_56910 [Duganella sp. HH105]|nr:hypothetical protein DUGA6_56910 [Duganella sp. HH105]
MSSDVKGIWPGNLDTNVGNAPDDIWMSEVAGKSKKDASVSPNDGIMKDATVQKYIKGMKEAFGTWKTDTIAGRIAHAQAVIDGVTTEAKLPSLPIISDADLDPRSKLTIENAVFDSRNWRMIVRADLLARPSLSAADAASLAGTIFHETRHSEQEFNILRYVEPSGWRYGGITAPASVVKLARANPLSSDSAIGIQAKTMYENMYGLGSARRTQILRELSSSTQGYNQTVQRYGAASSQAMFSRSTMMSSHDAYQAFPEESDAFSAGNKIINQWKR